MAPPKGWRHSPEAKTAIGDASKRLWSKDEHREAMSAGAAERLTDPAAFAASGRTPECNATRAAKMRVRWKDPEHRRKVARGLAAVAETHIPAVKAALARRTPEQKSAAGRAGAKARWG